jgi:hypothetical protein
MPGMTAGIIFDFDPFRSQGGLDLCSDAISHTHVNASLRGGPYLRMRGATACAPINPSPY